MKKLLFLLMAIPLFAASMVSCSDDDKDVVDVNIGFSYSGATDISGTLYTVQGDTLAIDSVFCNPAQGAKPAMITNVAYKLDGRPLGINPVPPFSVSILTESLPAGSHVLSLTMTVLQEGKSVNTAWMPIKIAVVQDETDIPSSANPSAIGTPSTYFGRARTSD